MNLEWRPPHRPSTSEHLLVLSRVEGDQFPFVMAQLAWIDGPRLWAVWFSHTIIMTERTMEFSEGQVDEAKAWVVDRMRATYHGLATAFDLFKG